MSKIVFCMPGKSYSREFLLSWTVLIMELSKKGYQIIVSQQYSSVVHFARAKCLGGNVLKGRGQKPFQGELDYDYIMWIDSDIVFKPEDFFNLLESPYDITSGIYMMEDLKNFAVTQEMDEYYFKKNGTYQFMTQADIDEEKTRYIPVEYTGMGWMLIRKGVIEKLSYPWFSSKIQKIDNLIDMESEDVAFCRALKESGFTIYIDSKIRVGHQKLLII